MGFDMQNIVGNERHKEIVSEYLEKRGGGVASNIFTFTESRLENNIQGDEGMQAYMKSRDDKTWSVGSKKLPKAAKPKIAVPTNAPPVADATPPSIPS